MPRQANANELIRRALSLAGYFLERLRETELRRVLVELGYPQPELEELGSLKLFSTLMCFCAVAHQQLLLGKSKPVAYQYVTSALPQWFKNSDSRSLPLAQTVISQLEPLFAVQSLRLLSAHAVTGDLDQKADDILADKLNMPSSKGEYRQAILTLYERLAESLDLVARRMV